MVPVHLDVPVEAWSGAPLRWASPDNPSGTGTTAWNPFAADTDYFEPGKAPFMVNYRVADLHVLLVALRSEGCNVVDESEFGKFGWVIDPEGNKAELWERSAGQ